MKLELVNTVFGLVLLSGQSLSSPLEQQQQQQQKQQPPDELSTLEPLSACEQGDCPDNGFGLDLLSTKDLLGWRYILRWQGRCGCSTWDVSEDGCAVITPCGVSHRVCLDWRSRRGHWIDDGGRKTCYSIDHGYVCANEKWEAWPTAEVTCSW